MKYVPVVSSAGKPLMPCHAARARQLIREGKAVKRFNKGIFYIQLLHRCDGDVQSIAVGIGPGSMKEAFTVKSDLYTYVNLQTDAVTWVSGKVKDRADLRRSRRSRNAPYRKCRSNRSPSSSFLPPSTKSRWQLKLRVLKWLLKLYPISIVVVEDVSAVTKKQQRKWNKNFSAVAHGKNWFYGEVSALVELRVVDGYQTSCMRKDLKLMKLRSKLSNSFFAHCVDSWVLATSEVGIYEQPDNTSVMCITPLNFHRRRLHRQNFVKGGVKIPFGGTRSLGFKRGSWVKHPKYGVCYVGGTSKGNISLYGIYDGKRLTQRALPSDCVPLCYANWRLSA